MVILMFESDYRDPRASLNCGKMKSTWPDLIEASSVSVSVCGTITTLSTFGLSVPQYLGLGTNTLWLSPQLWIMYGRPETCGHFWKSPDTSLQSLTDAFLMIDVNRFL